jgi:hypothetical protein
VDELRDWLDRRLQVPAIRAVLGPGRYRRAPQDDGGLPGGRPEGWDAEGADDLVVETEIPFLRRHEDRLLEGVIDRLVLVRRGGRAVAGEVLDYKTDAIADGDEDGLSAGVARHAPQIDVYRAAVAEMYRLHPDRVKGILIFLTPGAVREVRG